MRGIVTGICLQMRSWRRRVVGGGIQNGHGDCLVIDPDGIFIIPGSLMVLLDDVDRCRRRCLLLDVAPTENKVQVMFCIGYSITIIMLMALVAEFRFVRLPQNDRDVLGSICVSYGWNAETKI